MKLSRQVSQGGGGKTALLREVLNNGLPRSPAMPRPMNQYKRLAHSRVLSNGHKRAAPKCSSKTTTILDFENDKRHIIPLRLAFREGGDLDEDTFDDLFRRGPIAGTQQNL